MDIIKNIKKFKYLSFEYNELFCKNCNTTTIIQNSIYKTDNANKFIGWLLQYQCQRCGQLKLVEEGYKPIDYVGIPKYTTCVCGGQLRRDTPIFCPNCLYDKTDENIELSKEQIVYKHRFDQNQTITSDDIDGDRWKYIDVDTENFEL